MNHFMETAGVLQPGPRRRPQHCINLRNLELTLLALNLGGNFVYEAEIHGSRFVLFRFLRDDGSKIALRVQQQWPIATHPEIIQTVVRREVYVLKKLESVQFQYSPKCLAFDFSFNNPIRHPFVVLNWVEGQQLIWTKDHPPMEQRMRIMSQLFQIQLELIDISLESGAETARQFYSRLIHDKLMVAPRGPPGAGGMPTQEDYWSQLMHLEVILGSRQDDKNYAIAHNNVTADNIIIDQDYNIECIIGWSHGGVYPIAQAATLPRLFIPNPRTANPLEAHLAAQTAVGDKIQYRHPLNLFNLALTPAKQAMIDWQSGNYADFRALYMLSMRHSDVHAWLARYGWRPPYCHSYNEVPRPPMPPPPPPPLRVEANVRTEDMTGDESGPSQEEAETNSRPS
ncbi:hypothetical protein V2A60_002211 [Cordyceps javanica]